MSGHSKWSTIKRKKEATDAARGKLFSKLSKTISTAVKTGGGANPETNNKLRVAIEEAKASNMPKANIKRALSKGSTGGDIEEFSYEGFGPDGFAIIVEGATDNRNRTGQEIKGIFERGGGRLAGPRAVSFNFKPRIMFVVEKKESAQQQILDLIDMGVEDIDETDDAIEVYVGQDDFTPTRQALNRGGFTILKSELVQQPISYQPISNETKAKRALSLLEQLEDNDDVTKVFANVDIPDKILITIQK